MRWVEKYNNNCEIKRYNKKPVAYKIIKDRKQKERKIHSILIYQMENNRKGCINRDKNGCKNIQKVFKSYMETWERPEKYRREYKIQ
jgi:hypothetical protein